MTVSDCWGSYNAGKNSRTIWLLHYDQLHLHVSQNKSFWLLLLHYGLIQTQNFELNEIACLSVQFSNHTEWSNAQACQFTNHHSTINHTRYLQWLKLLQLHNMCSKLAHIKIMWNFWLTLAIKLEFPDVWLVDLKYQSMSKDWTIEKMHLF